MIDDLGRFLYWLEADGDLIQIGAHLLDLIVDRTALRRLA